MKKAFTPLKKICPVRKSHFLTAFTLIEMMVVVAVVIVLVSIAVPSVLRSRVVANEGAAIANLKTLYNSAQSYHIDAGHYPSLLSDLSSAVPPYIDSVLGSGTKQGYEFIYQSPDSDRFIVNANPSHSGLLRGRYFFMDEGGSIRYRVDSQAGPSDEIIK